ncbi:MAG: F0F1 ATP synthase subunit delta [Opitutae bacterium]|nr:F0F1 ATP synthase subunit delta [Opitutae bacterium]
MRGDKKTRLLAKQLFKLSLVNGEVSAAQVAGVLGYLEKVQPRQPLTLLKLYHCAIAAELAKSRALVEHAGPMADSALQLIARAMTQKYRRPVTASAQRNDALLAGLRVRVGSDVYESSVAGQLAALSAAL